MIKEEKVFLIYTPPVSILEALYKEVGTHTYSFMGQAVPVYCVN